MDAKEGGGWGVGEHKMNVLYHGNKQNKTHVTYEIVLGDFWHNVHSLHDSTIHNYIVPVYVMPQVLQNLQVTQTNPTTTWHPMVSLQLEARIRLAVLSSASRHVCLYVCLCVCVYVCVSYARTLC